MSRLTWIALRDVNPMDNTRMVFLTKIADSGDSSLHLRFKGPTLDIFVRTPELIEASGSSTSVRVKFDDSPPMRQSWPLAEAYHVAFSPDPYGLLNKMQNAKRFYFEYNPVDRIPETVAFDVSGLSANLPAEEIAAHEAVVKKRVEAQVALRKRIPAHVHECSQTKLDGSLMFPGQWCWTDPDSEHFKQDLLAFPTKEEAIDNAMEMARQGLAFR
jgi:hypothetical protein